MKVNIEAEYDEWQIGGVIVQSCISCGKEIFTRRYTSYPKCDECAGKRDKKTDT